MKNKPDYQAIYGHDKRAEPPRKPGKIRRVGGVHIIQMTGNAGGYIIGYQPITYFTTGAFIKAVGFKEDFVFPDERNRTV